MVSIIWHRLDLRLADNPALLAAVKCGGSVVPVFIWAPEEEKPWEPGGASRWWLHQSLAALEAEYKKLGSRLIIRTGSTLSTLLTIIRETGAEAVFWNRRYEPVIVQRDADVETGLKKAGIAVEAFHGNLLRDPSAIKNKSGKPFQVFTPYWKHCLKLDEPARPLAAPRHLANLKKWPATLPLKELALEPKIPWDAGLRKEWIPGEAGGGSQLKQFLSGAVGAYDADRNRPDRRGTSRLSPYLHFGELSPRQIWHAVRDCKASPSEVSRYLTEIGWREFSHQLLVHFPKTPQEPLRPDFARFQWRQDAATLTAWQRGKTGFPMVDAGMRELWTTGFMHNRVRMIVSSFLVKDLLLSWNEGAAWFWDTLVDADLAQNTLGWQWSAGCGADAAPFFRIFNPTTQGEKFDPKGGYVRKWCPELAKLPDRWLHNPSHAPSDVLAQAGIKLGVTYPKPIVNHSIARHVALDAYSKIKRKISA